MQLISITELKRPGWSNAQITKDNVTEAIDIITDLINRESEEGFDEPPAANHSEGELDYRYNSRRDRYYGQKTPDALFRTVRDRYRNQDKSTWHSREYRRPRDGRSSRDDAHRSRARESNYNDPQHRRQSSEGRGHDYGRRNERRGAGYRDQGRGRDHDGYERDRRRYAGDNHFADNFRRHLGTVMGQRERRGDY